jgi:hypothetical protein
MCNTTRGSPCRSRTPTIRTATLEVRGDVERIEPDPAASFFRRIADRYSGDKPPPDAPPPGEAPSDAPDWVVIVVRPTGFSKH